MQATARSSHPYAYSSPVSSRETAYSLFKVQWRERASDAEQSVCSAHRMNTSPSTNPKENGLQESFCCNFFKYNPGEPETDAINLKRYMEKDVCAAEKKIRIALKNWGIKGILM